jgi:hypothetical protein
METLDPVCLKAAAADVIGGPLSLRAKLLRKLIVPLSRPSSLARGRRIA